MKRFQQFYKEETPSLDNRQKFLIALYLMVTKDTPAHQAAAAAEVATQEAYDQLGRANGMITAFTTSPQIAAKTLKAVADIAPHFLDDQSLYNLVKTAMMGATRLG